MSTDLKCSPREASDCPIFRFCHRGHVHVTAACGIDDINNLWLPLSCDLMKNAISNHSGRLYTKLGYLF